MAYRVFISATHEDADLAENLARRLEGAQIETVSERRPRRSRNVARLQAGLHKADEVIVLLTDKSLGNSWVMFEMGAAFSLRKRMTPVMVGVEERDLPLVLDKVQYVRYPDLDDYLSTLERRAKAGTNGSLIAAH